MAKIDYNLTEWKEFVKDAKLFNTTMNKIWHEIHTGPDFVWLNGKLDLSILKSDDLKFTDSHELFTPCLLYTSPSPRDS